MIDQQNPLPPSAPKAILAALGSIMLIASPCIVGKFFAQPRCHFEWNGYGYILFAAIVMCLLGSVFLAFVSWDLLPATGRQLLIIGFFVTLVIGAFATNRETGMRVLWMLAAWIACWGMLIAWITMRKP